MKSKASVAIGAVAVFAGSAFFANVVTTANKLSAAAGTISHDPAEQTKLVNALSRDSAYDKGAPSFDKNVAMEEFLTGIKRRRKLLVGKAHGSCLEVAAGTGRNIDYYPPNVSVVFTDKSQNMLELCKAKLQKEAATWSSRYQCVTADGASLPFPDQQFDTVVETFGLCSVDDPVQVLKEMSRVCKQRTGRILLLEHGRSTSWTWLSRQLDVGAYKHATKWGCWWNRDIKRLVEEAGLNILEIETSNLGTTYYIVAAPASIE